jgi:hypothetical protein
MIPDLASVAHQPTYLKTISDNGAAPKSRLSSPSDTKSLNQLLIDGDRERSRWDAMLKGMADGNPPYNTAKRRAASQAWRANFSTLEGKSYLSNALVPYYDLFSSSTYYIDFQTAYGSVNQQQDWSGIITEELDVTLKQWKGFDFNVWSMLHDFVGYGQGFLVWNNSWDWRFKRIGHRYIRVLNGSDADLDTLPLLIISQSYHVHELWGKIQDEATAKASGWNPDAVKQAIREAVPKRPNSQSPPDWQMVQQELKDHDLLESARASTVQAARVYVKEFDGKITELIIAERGESEFLFRKERRYANFYQVLAPFFLEVMDGSWHGATGLLRDVFNIVQTKDRLTCSEIDAAFLRTAITLQAKSASAMNKIGLIQIGAFNIIPPDFDVQQSQVLGDITTVIEVNNDLDQRLARNTGIYRASPQRTQGNPQTAAEAALSYQAQTVLGNSAVNRFYNQMDKGYEELVRRITNPNLSRTDESSIAALDFQGRCFRRGVPKAALLSRKSIRAFRSMGNGSIVMRQTALQSLLPLLQLLPQSGRSNLVDDAISVYANQSKVERYNPKPELASGTDQQALAVLENAAMKTGSQVVWTDTQDNLIHSEVHLKASADGAASLSQGANPMEVLSFMEMVGPHIALHLQHLSQDPSNKQQYIALEAEYQRLGQVADKLHAQIQKMQQQQQMEAQKKQQAQQIMQGVDGDTAIKAATAQAKIQQSNIKTQVSLRQKEEKHQQALKQTAQDMAIKDAQAAADIALEKQKADAANTTSE